MGSARFLTGSDLKLRVIFLRLVRNRFRLRVSESVRLHQFFDSHVRILVQDIQKLNEVPDDLSGRDVLVRADPSVLLLDKGNDILGSERSLIPVEVGVNIRQFLAQDQHFLRGERLQPYDRCQKIPCARS